MAKNIKYTPDGMFGDIIGDRNLQLKKDTEGSEAREVREVREEPSAKADAVREVSEVRDLSENAHNGDIAPEKRINVPRETSEELTEEMLDSTRGRKGQKMNKLIFNVSDEIYEYVVKESRRRGISRRLFVCQIIKEYKDSPKGRADIED